MSRRARLSSAPASPPEAAADLARDLVAELSAIQEWLWAHPAVTANSVSLEAGLSRNSLSNLLRANAPETPTAQRLDKLYDALRRYGFVPQGPGLPVGVALTGEAAAQLLHLASLGYVLTLSGPGRWTVLQLDARAAELAGQAVSSGPTPALALVEAQRQLLAEGTVQCIAEGTVQCIAEDNLRT